MRSLLVASTELSSMRLTVSCSGYPSKSNTEIWCGYTHTFGPDVNGTWLLLPWTLAHAQKSLHVLEWTHIKTCMVGKLLNGYVTWMTIQICITAFSRWVIARSHALILHSLYHLAWKNQMICLCLLWYIVTHETMQNEVLDSWDPVSALLLWEKGLFGYTQECRISINSV